MKTARTKQAKAPEPRTPAKPKAVRKKPAAAKGETETRSMRSPSRLPSVADVEAVAKQGPPIVKILRLIQLRAALLEAQVTDENVAQTG